MDICNGNGECLIQTESPFEYIKNKEIECIFSCEAKKCKYYEYCETPGPAWLIDSHDGMCPECAYVAKYNRKYKKCVNCGAISSAWVIDSQYGLCLDCIHSKRKRKK